MPNKSKCMIFVQSDKACYIHFYPIYEYPMVYTGQIWVMHFIDKSDTKFSKKCFISQADSTFCFFTNLEPFLNCKLR